MSVTAPQSAQHSMRIEHWRFITNHIDQHDGNSNGDRARLDLVPVYRLIICFPNFELINCLVGQR